MAYSSIVKPTDYFNTVLWTGNGTDDRSITGVGFKPDWVWYKERSNVGDHTVHDIVRGAGERLFTADTSAESLDANSLQAFESDGFQIGTNSDVNGNTETYVGWSWLGGGTASSNTDGSITSTVSANTTAGFSIVSYTGNGSTNQTIGHGLGVEPDFIIIKARSTTMNWPTYQKVMGNGVAFLDLTDAWASGSGYDNYWYTSGMTSSTFGVSNNINTNTSGATFIAYVFSSKTGYSKFGSYTGNGNADGTFVYTGFKPAFIMVKGTNESNQDWAIFDNKRDPINKVTQRIQPSSSAAESGGQDIDFLSNGVKFRVTGDFINGSYNYIYMAFAEAPLVANDSGIAVPVVAR